MATPKEIDRRHRRLREAMAAAGYDALVIVGNTEFQQKGYIRYYANWRLYGGTAFLVMPATQDPVLVMGLGAQAEWAKELSAIADTRAVLDKIEGVAAALKDCVNPKSRIGIVGMKSIMPYGDAVRLADALPENPIDDATDASSRPKTSPSSSALMPMSRGSSTRSGPPSGRRAPNGKSSARLSRSPSMPAAWRA